MWVIFIAWVLWIVLLWTWICEYVFKTMLLLNISPKAKLSQSRICLHCRRPRFNPWLGKIPWRRKWRTIPVSLPGKIPWAKEPGVQSMGLQRVRHDRATNTFTFQKQNCWIIGYFCFQLFWGTSILFSVVIFCSVGYFLCHFSIAPVVHMVSDFFTSLSTLVIFSFVDTRYNGCKSNISLWF